MSLQTLSVGQSVRDIRVCARRAYNPTGVTAEPGQTFRFVADGLWFDARIESGPGGQSGKGLQRLAGSLKRFPAAPWFALIGAIEKDDESLFVIGKGSVWTNN